MERYWRLDIVGPSPAAALIFILLWLLFVPIHLDAQVQGSSTEKTQEIRKLYDAGRWEEALDAIAIASNDSADLDLYRGLSLAKLGRFPEAAEAFRLGAARYPHDARFPAELAGLAYREKNFARAKTYLRHALSLDPQDRYTDDFLASVYFLEGNLDAALKYWNRDGKPVLNDLALEVSAGLNPLILDQVFEFSRGSEWRRDQFLTMRARLESLDLFPQMRFDLQALPDGSFNLAFKAVERSRWGGTSLTGLASLLRGLPYQSLYPEFYNLNHNGLNWLSFARWDAQKRRVSSEVSAPLPEGPQKRFRVYFDGRNENWNLTETLSENSRSPAGMNMRRVIAGAEIRSIPDWRWQWNLGAEYSYRDFRAIAGIPAQAAPFFTNTSGIALRLEMQRALIRFPERRFALDSSASAEFGKFFTGPLGRYGRVAGSLTARWLPQAQGDDYETRSELRAGRTFGEVPFDDLLTLGFDRDNSLWMRGHNALIDGRKGNAPLGRNYILSNTDFAKVLYRNPFFQIKAGPFLDTGDIYDPSGFFGSPEWLMDSGLQTTLGVLGRFQFVLGWGRDLRSGRNTFYTTVLR